MHANLHAILEQLRADTATLTFTEPVAYVYRPLEYAAEAQAQLIERYGAAPKRALLLGMNPGPFGMAQTGIPFGAVAPVRDWLGIDATIARPTCEHPKRPVLGLNCPRQEVSGTRLWGWAVRRYGTPQRFFGTFWVHNYCPLLFLEAGGRNRTPEKLPAREREPLEAACDTALARIAAALDIDIAIGVGTFAAARLHRVLGGQCRIAPLLHPSPASPAANRGWEPQADTLMDELGL